MVNLVVQHLKMEGVLILIIQKLSLADSHHLMSPMKKEGPRKQRQRGGLATHSKKAISGSLLFKVQEGVSQEESLLLYWWGEFNMKKGGVFDMEGSRERSMEEGDVGVDTNCSRSGHVPWRVREQTEFPECKEPLSLD